MAIYVDSEGKKKIKSVFVNFGEGTKRIVSLTAPKEGKVTKLFNTKRRPRLVNNKRVSLDFANTWITEKSNLEGAVLSIVYGKGLFVAITVVNSVKRLYYSFDGLGWIETDVTSKGNDNYGALAYGNGRFVATFGGTAFYYSDDGLNWHTLTLTPPSGYAAPDKVCSICYGSGYFIFVNRTTSSFLSFRVADNVDSASITYVTIASSSNAYTASLAYGNGTFILIGNLRDANGNDVLAVKYSTNGTSWTNATGYSDATYLYSYQGADLDRIAFGKTTFVALSSKGLYRSTDGKTWTLVNADIKWFESSYQPGAVTYADGRFFVIVKSGVYTSGDEGLTWIQLSTLGSTSYNLTFGDYEDVL